MLYIQNRYDRNGNRIEDVEKYEPQHTEELRGFLNEIYADNSDVTERATGGSVSEIIRFGFAESERKKAV